MRRDKINPVAEGTEWWAGSGPEGANGRRRHRYRVVSAEGSSSINIPPPMLNNGDKEKEIAINKSFRSSRAICLGRLQSYRSSTPPLGKSGPLFTKHPPASNMYLN